MSRTYWLSYGGGVNSTALAILLCEGKLPQYTPFKAIFSDTGNEKDETYAYIREVFEPYLAHHGRKLIRVNPALSVLEYWQSYSMVGSRVIRSCTDKAKIKPLNDYVNANGRADDARIIGIDAGEPHRAKQHEKDTRLKLFPLVDLGIDRAGCEAIIKAAGLPVPPKSGCWHCPFMRVGEVRELFWKHPDRFAAIGRLEATSWAVHPLPPTREVVRESDCIACGGAGELVGTLFDGPCQICDGTGTTTTTTTHTPRRAQWADTPVTEWVERFKMEAAQGRLIDLPQDRQYDEIPCGCFDGDAEDDSRAIGGGE